MIFHNKILFYRNLHYIIKQLNIRLYHMQYQCRFYFYIHENLFRINFTEPQNCSNKEKQYEKYKKLKMIPLPIWNYKNHRFWNPNFILKIETIMMIQCSNYSLGQFNKYIPDELLFKIFRFID